ncbi:hypothetical protein CRG98_040369 [Punica granatum]|uniref:Uncharacterized protein n=1 Tax=Punica granatum TaxID=22663 RepID=A0A2I0I6E0_PUNGR|nr:hypothetical protein CRG98_040369 [Punica granatum]
MGEEHEWSDEGGEASGSDEGDVPYNPGPSENGQSEDEEFMAHAFQLVDKIENASARFNAECSRQPKPKWRAHLTMPSNPILEVEEIIERAQAREEDVEPFNKKEDGCHIDELESLTGSDDEDDEKKPVKFNEKAPYGEVHLELEMVFKTLDLFKEAVKDYNIYLGRVVQFKKNDKKRCMAVCNEKVAMRPPPRRPSALVPPPPSLQKAAPQTAQNASSRVTVAPFEWRGAKCVRRETLMAASCSKKAQLKKEIIGSNQ